MICPDGSLSVALPMAKNLNAPYEPSLPMLLADRANFAGMAAP